MRVYKSGATVDKPGPSRSLTPEQEHDIVERYVGGEEIPALAEAFSIGRTSVRRTLARLDITIRPTRRLSGDEKHSIIEAAGRGEYGTVIAERLGVSTSAVCLLLKENDLSPGRGRRRSCTVNDAAFDVLTPESLYWMGFLFTDGAVSPGTYGSPSVRTNIAEKDLKHVEKLRAFLGSNHKIGHSSGISKDGKKTRLGGPAVSLGIRSKRLVAALATCGMVPGKTKRAPSPEVAASRDFWRGAIDGDGGLGTVSIRGRIYPHVGLAGQLLLLERFQQFLKANNLAALNCVQTESGIWRIETSGSTAGDIIRVLYKDATEALIRKNARAQTIIAGNIHLFPPYIEGSSALPVDSDENDLNND